MTVRARHADVEQEANTLILGTPAHGRLGFSADHGATGPMLVLDFAWGMLGLRERKARQSLTSPFGGFTTSQDYFMARAQRMLPKNADLIRFEPYLDAQDNVCDRLVIPCSDPSGLTGVLAGIRDGDAVLDALRIYVRSVVRDLSASWFLGDWNPLYVNRIKALGPLTPAAVGGEEIRQTPKEAAEWQALKGMARDNNWSVGDLMGVLGHNTAMPSHFTEVRHQDLYAALVAETPLLDGQKGPERPVIIAPPVAASSPEMAG